MAFLSSLCCCIPSTPAPEMTEPALQSRRDQNHQTHQNHSLAYNNTDDGYTPTIPLPRYTPRPMSIQEKTLEAHMHDPPVSSSSPGPQPPPGPQTYTSDEKHHYEYDDGPVTADDVSSAFSFQSSYGNTSTATRETPPPPYSPASTPSRRSMSLSISSSGADHTYPPQQQQPRLPMVHIAQPQAVFQRPEWMGMVRSPRCSVDEEVESR